MVICQEYLGQGTDLMVFQFIHVKARKPPQEDFVDAQIDFFVECLSLPDIQSNTYI